MEHLFISPESAVKAKENGFNEACFMFYTNEKKLRYRLEHKECVNNNLPYPEIAAPTHQQIVDWFRVEHKIYVNSDLLPNIKKYAATFVPLALTPKDLMPHNYYSTREKFSTPDRFDDYYGALNKAIEEAFKAIEGISNLPHNEEILS